MPKISEIFGSDKLSYEEFVKKAAEAGGEFGDVAEMKKAHAAEMNRLRVTGAVTVLFYFILEHFETANIIPSTLSVTTSFVAVYLTFRRSPYFAVAYAANDIVLIILWIMATLQDVSYLSVVICFVMFFVNDLYGFYNWKRMQRRQEA